MINHILLIFFSIFVYEFIKYIKFNLIIKSNLRIYKKLIKITKSRNVSDFRKEKLILNYSKSLFIVSIKILIIIISIFILVFFLNLLTNSYLNLMTSILGIIELSIVFIIYHLIRKNFNEKL